MPMLTGRPSAFLFQHTIDHYTNTYSKDAGAFFEGFTLVGSYPCFKQPAPAQIIEQFLQINKRVTDHIFFKNESDWAAIKLTDRLVFDGDNYEIVGLKNSCDLGRVFSAIVAREVR